MSGCCARGCEGAPVGERLTPEQVQDRLSWATYSLVVRNAESAFQAGRTRRSAPRGCSETRQVWLAAYDRAKADSEAVPHGAEPADSYEPMPRGARGARGHCDVLTGRIRVEGQCWGDVREFEVRGRVTRRCAGHAGVRYRPPGEAPPKGGRDA